LQCYDGCPVSGREDVTPQTAGTSTLLVDNYGSSSIATPGAAPDAHLLRAGHVTSAGSYAATLPCSKADHLGLGGLVDDNDYHSPLCIAHHHHHYHHPANSPPTAGVSQSRDVVVPDVTSSPPRRCQLYLYDCPPTSAAAV